MIRPSLILALILSLFALASCGVDGAPIRPGSIEDTAQ
jgi:predicted small lipoprotein YifL